MLYNNCSSRMEGHSESVIAFDSKRGDVHACVQATCTSLMCSTAELPVEGNPSSHPAEEQTAKPNVSILCASRNCY